MTLEFTPEKWVYGGDALGRVEGHVVMAPYLLPGEKARVEIVRERGGFREARLAEVLERSPDRVEAPCPIFGSCGGCHYQMADYAYQLARKVEILREVFRRVGHMEAPAEIEVVSGEPWEYRNRTQFHIDRGKVGFLAAGSHRLVAVKDRCPISAPAINVAFGKLRDLVHHPRWPRFVSSVELFTNGDRTLLNVLETQGGRRAARGFFDWCGEQIPGAAAGEIDYEVNGISYRVSHGSFFQTNRHLAGPLVECALRQAEGTTALDLYSGVGLFSVPLAKRGLQVSAVESSLSATRDLEANAVRAKVAIAVHRINADQYLEKLETAPDLVLADPPRNGLGKAVVQHLVRLKPPRITVVSCDPATQARDLAGLLAAGYKLDHLTLVDLFPQTYHLETVAHLSCTDSSSLG